MSSPHSSQFFRPNKIRWTVQINKLIIMYFSPLPCYRSLLGPNIFLNTLFSNNLSLRPSLNVSDQVVSLEYVQLTLNAEIIALYVSYFFTCCCPRCYEQSLPRPRQYLKFKPRCYLNF
jgi:hypothetical protein